mmetsp:Transcript_24087/g.74880  ORF Transcript_24087/g.74880 Transcript_24087/m.74880 type:complete len:275 (+) Transcript_24087:263-1087(+)
MDQQEGLHLQHAPSPRNPGLVHVVLQSRAEVPAASYEVDAPYKSAYEVDYPHTPEALEPRHERTLGPGCQALDQACQPHQPREARYPLQPRYARHPEVEVAAAAGHENGHHGLPETLGHAREEVHPKEALEVLTSNELHADNLVAPVVPVREEKAQHQVPPENDVHDQVDGVPTRVVLAQGVEPVGTYVERAEAEAVQVHRGSVGQQHKDDDGPGHAKWVVLRYHYGAPALVVPRGPVVLITGEDLGRCKGVEVHTLPLCELDSGSAGTGDGHS